ncbi:helix-turn-helix domain-containing protein (plasmid) [Nicoliella spurrieriana]|uniref:Helix-turn-helix domain-containing protein n=1 Tax=Nicoliella spurrieriana TaxID=2925830 RepID=A0A976X4W2_9LACO|nr:helix-turn-helix transcriptional regulator [Nicoliella spurrieriana]UQS86175.1 helix-turn-helix domain-containing protein [Nicoliella spurrieriana]
MNSEERMVPKSDELKAIMKKKNLSNAELDSLMGVNVSTVCHFMNGKRGMSATTIGKLLNSLNLSSEDFNRLFIFNQSLPKGNGMIT